MRLLMRIVASTASAALLTVGGVAAADPAIGMPDRQLVAEAMRLFEEVQDQVWPGWDVPFEIVLVAGEREMLIGSDRIPEGFSAPLADSLLGPVAARDRSFPSGLEATMPVFGPPATVVVGTVEATGRTPTTWLLMLLHEHFHQWQMRAAPYFEEVAALDLAAGDTTGRWMLDYPFPYDDPEIGARFAHLARELAGLLRRSAGEELDAEAARFWSDYSAWVSSLDERDARYLRFQLWQEGVARFVELRVAEAAAARFRPAPEVVEIEGFEDFAVAACSAWERLFEQLEEPALASRQRVSFYAFGAGLALLLDRTDSEWKGRYEAPRFALAPN